MHTHQGFDLFPLPFADAETNETRANELQRIRADPALMEKELAGGLDCEEVDAARFHALRSRMLTYADVC
jgi:hypothetical protein